MIEQTTEIVLYMAASLLSVIASILFLRPIVARSGAGSGQLQVESYRFIIQPWAGLAVGLGLMIPGVLVRSLECAILACCCAVYCIAYLRCGVKICDGVFCVRRLIRRWQLNRDDIHSIALVERRGSDDEKFKTLFIVLVDGRRIDITGLVDTLKLAVTCDRLHIDVRGDLKAYRKGQLMAVVAFVLWAIAGLAIVWVGLVWNVHELGTRTPKEPITDMLTCIGGNCFPSFPS